MFGMRGSLKRSLKLPPDGGVYTSFRRFFLAGAFVSATVASASAGSVCSSTSGGTVSVGPFRSPEP